MSSAADKPRSVITLLQEYSIPLLAGVVAALVWVNVSPHSYETILHAEPVGMHLTLHFFANDVLMVFFFGLAAKEITEACLPGGALNPPRKAVNPLMGTLGGVVGPIGIYFVMVALLDAPTIRNGWGIPTATDIALAWLVARLAFGARHPAVSYLLLLAVADDAVGLAIIAIFYPDPAHPVQPVFLLLVLVAMVMAYVLKRRRVMSFWPYLLAGLVSWFGLHEAYLHPALALVPVVPFMPNRGRDEGMYQEGELGGVYHDTLNKFEHFFKAPVDFGLFFFGLANAGVLLSSVGSATWAVLAALVIGKSVGITVFSWGAHAVGFNLPSGMNLRALMMAALTAGLGLTVALFVAGVAFEDATLQGSAKMGALMSAAVAPLVLLLARLLRIERKDTVELGEPEPMINPSGRPSFRGTSSRPSSEGEMDLGPE